MIKIITLGSSDPHRYFENLPDQITIIMERGEPGQEVNIVGMKEKIANYISLRLQNGSLIIKNNMCRYIQPDTIDIPKLDSLDKYDDDIYFKILPISYTVIFPNPNTPAIHIKALCEDDLNNKLLPLNYRIGSIDRVGVDFVARVIDIDIENAESLATLVHTGKTNRYLANRINTFLTGRHNPKLDNGIFYKYGKAIKSRKKRVKKSRRRGRKTRILK